MIKKLLTLLVATAALTGCAGLQSAGSTVKSGFDLGVELCQLYYSEHPEHARALTPKDVCQFSEAVQPFVDIVLAEKEPAGARSAAAMKARR